MGSSNSRLGPRSSRSGHKRSHRRLVASLFCGSSVSSDPVETEDHVDELSTGSLENSAPCTDGSASSQLHSYSTFGSEIGFSNSINETHTSTGAGNTRTRAEGNPSVNQLHSPDDGLMEAHAAGARAPSKEQPSTTSASSDTTVASREDQDPENLHSDGESIGDASIDFHPADSGSVVSDPLVNAQPLLGFLLSDGEHDSREASLLFVDMVSIPSNNLSSSNAEISNREARRNTRRMFWNAFSRSSFQRNSYSPTIVFTTNHADDLGSHDRWLLDFSGDLHYDGVGLDSGYSGDRNRHRSGRRWQSRYEMSERFHDVHDERGWQTSLCATGLHPHGTCSCESLFMAEQSSSRASISQIIMLADALFEVLEEIHRHRMSLSGSSLSLPAPEAVVNSFPLKDHKKLQGNESGAHDVQQCHICLVDYEEGDKIRVLPCAHEYHMSCVDKWLKEIHGICPLCRDEVCKGVEGPVSNPEIPSL